MQTLTPEMKLRALLMTKPEKPEWVDSNYCALKQAACAMNADRESDLDDIAIQLGFSVAEAFGIMDGWDTGRKRSPYFMLHAARPGYTSGFALGLALSKEFV